MPEISFRSRPSVRFLPASQLDFSRYAKSLVWLLGIKAQQAQELLSRIYGYEHLHELQQAMKVVGATPGPFWDEAPWDGATRTDESLLLYGVAGERPFWPAAVLRDWKREFGVKDSQHDRDSLIVELGLTDTPESHRSCFKRVKALVEESEITFDPWGFPTGFLGLLASYNFDWRDGIASTPLDQPSIRSKFWRRDDPINPSDQFILAVRDLAVDAYIKLAEEALPDSEESNSYYEFDNTPFESFWKYMVHESPLGDHEIDACFEKVLGVNLQDSPEPLDDAQFHNLLDFVQWPNRSRYKACGLSSVSYSDALERIGTWKASKMLDCASTWRARNKPLILLTSSTFDEEQRQWTTDHGEIQVLLAPRDLDDEYGSAVLADVIATFIVNTPSGKVTAGCLQGWMFIPCNEGFYISDGDLSYFLGDHELIKPAWDVAKRYMAIRGVSSMKEWVNSEEGCGVVSVKAIMGAGFDNDDDAIASMAGMASNALDQEDAPYLTSELAYWWNNLTNGDFEDLDPSSWMIPSSGLIALSLEGAKGVGIAYYPEDDESPVQNVFFGTETSHFGSRRFRRSYSRLRRDRAANEPVSRIRNILKSISGLGSDLAIFDAESETSVFSSVGDEE